MTVPFTPIKGWKKPVNIREYEIDWSNPLTRGLTHFLPSDGGAIVNMANGEKWRTNEANVVELNKATQYGTASIRSTVNDHHADAPIFNTGYRPIDTSDGVGTGAYTLMSIAAPRAEANRRFCISQRATNYHTTLMCNTNTAGTVKSGTMAFQPYNVTGGYAGAAIDNGCDGEFHAYVGVRREDFTAEIWVDGGDLFASQANTSRTVYTNNDSSLYMYVGGYNSGSTFGMIDPVLMCATWSRDLTAAEIKSISADPWQLLRPIVATRSVVIREPIPEVILPDRLVIDDYLLRAPALLVPKKHPVGVGLDILHDHPLVKEWDLRGCWPLWGISGYGIVKDYSKYGHHAAGTGTSVQSISNIGGNGLHIKDDTASSRLDLGSTSNRPTLTMNDHNEISIFAYGYVPTDAESGNAFPRIIEKSSSGTAGGGWGFFTRGTTAPSPASTLDLGINTLGIESGAGSLVHGQYHSMGVTSKSGSIDFFIDDGVKINKSNTFSIPSTATNAAILNWNHTNDRQWRGGPLHIVYVWPYKIPDEWMYELCRNPYLLMTIK